MTTVSGSSSSSAASACATVSVPPGVPTPTCGGRGGQASAYATLVCPQRADPRKAIPRLAYGDGLRTASWLLEPHQEPFQQTGLPWELPRQDEGDELEGAVEDGVGGLAGCADHLERPPRRPCNCPPMVGRHNTHHLLQLLIGKLQRRLRGLQRRSRCSSRVLCMQARKGPRVPRVRRLAALQRPRCMVD